MNLILHKILETQNLEIWSKLRKEFFEPPYTEIYSLVDKFYNKFDKLPSFEELEIVIRDERHSNYITALKHLDVPDDLDIEIILQALINDFAQRKILSSLSKYLDNIIFKDVGEMVEDLSEIAIEVEESTEINEQVVLMNEYYTIDKDEISSRVMLGLNNDFDSQSLGLANYEFVLFGGYRGSGKSVICSNIACVQYLQGNSCLYFTIEMGGRELYNRHLAILSDVYEKHIKVGNLNQEEKDAICKVRAGMTEDGAVDLLEKYYDDRNFREFEEKVIHRPLKFDNQIITIDNNKLTIPNIDAAIHKYKAKLGDKLKIVVVDYINKIHSNDPYDWKTQIDLSYKLKALARKYEVVMVSPYQISEEGKVRFSKGILDSADWAFNLTPVKEDDYGALEFECKKSRGDESIDFASEIHWPTLKILPHKNIDFMKNKNKSTAPKESPKTDDDLRI